MKEESAETIISKHIANAGFSSMREFERQLNCSNGAIRKFLQRPKPSLVTMLTILQALNYKCDSPEMLLIKQICGTGDLKSPAETNKISTVQKRKQSKRNVHNLSIKSSKILSVA